MDDWRTKTFFFLGVLVIMSLPAFLPEKNLRFLNSLSEEVVAAPTPTVIPCPEWRMAGGQIIYKCVDDEAPWATCYQPLGGVLQCLKE